jgi:hypothetical protein
MTTPPCLTLSLLLPQKSFLPENLLKLSLPKELFKRIERTTTERMRILTESSFIVFLHHPCLQEITYL